MQTYINTDTHVYVYTLCIIIHVMYTRYVL